MRLINISKSKYVTGIAVLLLILLVLCACKTNIPNNETSYEAFGITFQPDRKDLPSLEMFDEIKVGQTSVTELVEIVGSPQSSDTNGLASCTYYTSYVYRVRILLAQYMGNNTSDNTNTIEIGSYYVYDINVEQEMIE